MLTQLGNLFGVLVYYDFTEWGTFLTIVQLERHQCPRESPYWVLHVLCLQLIVNERFSSTLLYWNMFSNKHILSLNRWSFAFSSDNEKRWWHTLWSSFETILRKQLSWIKVDQGLLQRQLLSSILLLSLIIYLFISGRHLTYIYSLTCFYCLFHNLISAYVGLFVLILSTHQHSEKQQNRKWWSGSSHPNSKCWDTSWLI